MGKRDRVRFEQTGQVFRDGRLVNAVKARDVSFEEMSRMRRVGHDALQALGTGNQVKILRDALHQGRLSPGKLRKTLMDNAPREMRKATDKMRGHKKAVTIDALLGEYRKDRDFRELASEVGLDKAYFINLAKKEMADERGGKKWT